MAAITDYWTLNMPQIPTSNIVGLTDATVAASVADLGDGIDGKTGLIRAGTTPFEFIPVTYDATYGKWVGPVMHSGFTNYSTDGAEGTRWQQATGVGFSIACTLVVPYAVCVTAGLGLMVRGEALIAGTTSDGTYAVRTSVYTRNDNGTADTGSASQTEVTSAGVAAGKMLRTAWNTAAPTSGDVATIATEFQKTGGTNNVWCLYAGVWARWEAAA